MRKWLTIAITLSLSAVAWGTPDAEGESHFRFGPFFEWRSDDALGMTRFAIRPFYAWEQSTLNPADEDMEIAWPLTHFSWRGDARQGLGWGRRREGAPHLGLHGQGLHAAFAQVGERGDGLAQRLHEGMVLGLRARHSCAAPGRVWTG